MKKLSLLPLLFAATLAGATDIAYSPPVGGMTLSAAANTDTLVSVALMPPPDAVGAVASVSGSDITVAGAPNWTANGFVSLAHYVRVLSGALKGHYFSVLANTNDTLTVDSAGMNLATLAAADAVEITPYWTLGTLYSPANAGASFIASASPLARQTEVYFYDATATGINRAPYATYYFYNGAWRKVGSAATTSFSNTIIFPDTYFLQRNKTGASALVYTGRVQPASVGTLLVGSTGQNDNHVALAFPITVTLNSSGLAGSGFVASSSPLSRKDELYWFDPAGTGINRAPSATYYYYNSGWRKVGSPATTDFGSSVLLTAGGGFLIRKAANGPTVPWVFNTGF